MIRTGIILAAGTGSRLNQSETAPFLKPFVLLQGKPLLIRTIESLEKAHCNPIIVVLGWEAENLQKKILDWYRGPLELKFVFNKRHDLQNGISLLSAKPFIDDEFILTMADHLFDDKIMRLLSTHRPPSGGAVLCVDYKLGTIFDMDDATKVFEKNGRVKKIGKAIHEYNCIDTGAFIGTQGLIHALDMIFVDRGDVSLTEGVQALADSGRMEILDIGDALWQDVDTPEMLQHAETLLEMLE